MAKVLTGEIAKYQIQDRVEAAERDRAAHTLHVRRRRERAPAVRTVASGLLASVVGSRRKTTRAPAPIELPIP